MAFTHEHANAAPAARPWLDRAGMVASSLCAVHCLALPFVIAAVPTLAFSFAAGPGEWLLVGLALAVGAGSLLPSFLRHRDVRPLVLFAAGLVILGGGRALLPEGVPEAVCSAIGGVLFVTAHAINLRAAPPCDHCETN